MSFENKVVIITGASSGIGAATAIAFSSQGAHVVLVGRNEAKLSSVAKKCHQPLIINADVSKDEDVERIIVKTVEKFGELHILVNNAGIYTNSGALLDKNMMEVYDKTMNVNVRAAVYISNLAAPYLVRTKGNIVNISSISGTSSLKSGCLSYCISKAALNHFTFCAAAELGPLGVRVNAISPGPVKTDLLESCMGPNINWDDFCKFTSLGRVSDSEEVAELILFLAGDKGKSVTGANYFIDNGFMVKQS